MADDNKRDEDKRRSAEDERKHAADAEAKRIAQAEEDRKQKAAAEDERKRAAAQAQLVPNAEGNVMVEVIMGPYRGQNLTMTAADGQAAINTHWARNPTEAHYEHEALDDEHRKEAIDAAHAWARAQWDAAQGIEPDGPPPEGGVTKRRAMKPDEGTDYKTR